MIYDYAVIGGGPAGATFARCMSGKGKGILIDAKKMDGQGPAKPCGGLLAPDAQKVLAEQGLCVPSSVLANPQIFSVDVLDVASGNTRAYQRAYVNVDRGRFDSWLLAMLPTNVQRCVGMVTGIEREGDLFKIRFCDEKGKHISVISKNLIGAEGANSLVRKLFFPKIHPRTEVAIQQWFYMENDAAGYNCIFDHKTSPSCSWMISKDAMTVFGGAFSKKNCRQNFEKQKERLRLYGIRLDNPVRTEACQILRPKGMRDFASAKDHVFLVGEAAGLISPSSMEGISRAMKSAQILADCFCAEEKKREHIYRRKIFCIQLALLAKHLKVPFMYKKALRNVVLLSGIASLKTQISPHEITPAWYNQIGCRRREKKCGNYQ